MQEKVNKPVSMLPKALRVVFINQRSPSVWPEIMNRAQEVYTAILQRLAWIPNWPVTSYDGVFSRI